METDRAAASPWRVRWMSLVAGGLLWEAVARLLSTPFLPSCTATIAALGELVQSGVILGNLATSLVNLAIGFAWAACVGVAAGIAMTRIRHVDAVLEPYLHALLAAPGMIYVPLLFTFFGASRLTQIGSVFLHAVFLVAATTAGALRPKQQALTAMAAAFGATDRQIFWRVTWPAGRPLIVSGLRVGSLLAVKGMINGEMFIAFTGLGALIRTHGARFEPDKVLAIVMVVVAVALLVAAAIDAAERRLVRTPA